MIECNAWTVRLAAELACAESDGSVESVHKLRVAAGRLSVALELAGRRALRDDLRTLRRSAARMRDLDVWIPRATTVELASWLREERAREHACWVAGRDHERTDALITALRLLPPIPTEVARAGVKRLKHRVFEAGRGLARADARDWHRLRRRLRRLRYALDWIGEDSKAVETLQEELGELNNLNVGRRLLESCPSRAGLHDERSLLSATMGAQRLRALDAWRNGRARIEGD